MDTSCPHCRAPLDPAQATRQEVVCPACGSGFTPAEGSTTGWGPVRPAAAAPEPGTMVGHYQVLGRLGGGGMGVVHEATDTRLGRRVALKFLPREYAQDAAALARF